MAGTWYISTAFANGHCVPKLLYTRRGRVDARSTFKYNSNSLIIEGLSRKWASKLCDVLSTNTRSRRPAVETYSFILNMFVNRIIASYERKWENASLRHIKRLYLSHIVVPLNNACICIVQIKDEKQSRAKHKIHHIRNGQTVRWCIRAYFSLVPTFFPDIFVTRRFVHYDFQTSLNRIRLRFGCSALRLYSLSILAQICWTIAF